MVRFLGVGALVLIAAVLQSTLLHGIAPGNVTPDLVLVLVLSGGLSSNSAVGASLGFLGGACLGAECGNLPGALALAYLAVGWAGGGVADRGHGDNLLICLATASVATCWLVAVEYFELHMLPLAFSYSVSPSTVTLLMGYHTVLILPCLSLVRWVLKSRRTYPLDMWRGSGQRLS